MIGLILLIAALILFVLAGVGASNGRYNLGWLGMACLALSFLAGNAGLAFG